MLTIKLNGKAVSTSENKQTIHINDNPVEVERIGDAIYVNKVAINLVVVDKKTGFGKKVVNFVLVGTAIVAFAFAAANFDVVIRAADSVVQTVKPYTDSTIDMVQGYVSGQETAPTEPEQPAE